MNNLKAYTEIKKELKKSLNEIFDEHIELKQIFLKVFIHGSAYIVGGYLRDIIENREPRDIDIIVDMDRNEFMQILSEYNFNYTLNRHNGFKIYLDNIQIDLWTIEDNWAFRNNLVKYNEENKLDSIARGCFYNYDALVINLKTLNMDIKYYSNFRSNNELDILQKRTKYQMLNPTKEANILRAFYLKKQLNINYSSNSKQYLLKKIAELYDLGENPIHVLNNIKQKYPKYNNVLTDFDVKYLIFELINDNHINKQFHFKF